MSVGQLFDSSNSARLRLSHASSSHGSFPEASADSEPAWLAERYGRSPSGHGLAPFLGTQPASDSVPRQLTQQLRALTHENATRTLDRNVEGRTKAQRDSWQRQVHIGSQTDVA